MSISDELRELCDIAESNQQNGQETKLNQQGGQNQQGEPGVSTNNGGNVSIEPQAPSAAGSTAEDTLGEYKALIEQITLGEYKALIEQMKAQNAALIEQNKSLQNQFGVLIRNGASAGHYAGNEPEPEPEPEPYVSLAELGSQLGKRDYQSHNTKKE